MLPSPSACKAEEEKERDDNPAAKLAQAPNNSFLNELRGHFPFNFPSTDFAILVCFTLWINSVSSFYRIFHAKLERGTLITEIFGEGFFFLSLQKTERALS